MHFCFYYITVLICTFLLLDFKRLACISMGFIVPSFWMRLSKLNPSVYEYYDCLIAFFLGPSLRLNLEAFVVGDLKLASICYY